MANENILQQRVKSPKHELLSSPASSLKPLKDQQDEEVAVFLINIEALD